jgi:hypothetical protein
MNPLLFSVRVRIAGVVFAAVLGSLAGVAFRLERVRDRVLPAAVPNPDATLERPGSLRPDNRSAALAPVSRATRQPGPGPVRDHGDGQFPVLDEGTLPPSPDAADASSDVKTGTDLTIQQALFAEDDAVRMAALMALIDATGRSPEADAGISIREIFSRLLRNDKSPTLRAVALDALADVAGTDSWQEISNWGLGDKDVHVRTSALLAVQRHFIRQAERDLDKDSPTAREQWAGKISTLNEIALTLQSMESSDESEMLRAASHEMEIAIGAVIARLRN